MRAGLWIWPSFALLDAYMCFVAYPGAPFALFVAYRVALEIGFVAVYRVGLREGSDLDRLFFWHSLSYRAAAVIISLMAIHLGGIRSPYMHGISVVALVWAALEPVPWRQALPTFIWIGLAFPVVMGAGAAVSPAARAEWLTADALIVFVSNYVFVLASSVLSLLLSHTVWQAQQQAKRFGSYQLEALLGRGGMGEVWRARHRLLARPAAIKLVRPAMLSAGSEADARTTVRRFEHEAQATAALTSPHTIRLFDFGVADEGSFYYVMELLDGRDMASLVAEFGPLPPARAIFLLQQVCHSLAEAHSRGLVHRDIKPANIVVCRMGLEYDFVKVLDFGLVQVTGPNPTHDLTQSLAALEGVVGTPAFMAPEMIVGSGKVDHRADLYALGCVAYFLLTGQQVFQGGTQMQALIDHVSTAPRPPSTLAPAPIPRALDALVLECLEKDPARRPPDALTVAQRLSECAGARDWSTTQAALWWQAHLPDLSARLAPAADAPTRS
jgi:serine/threonine-protein kinase